MEVKAVTKSVVVSPRKIRLVADAVRNISAASALNILSLTRKRGALSIKKTLESAIANALNNAKLNKDLLFVKRIEVSGGPAYKRFHPSTRGRVHPYKKRTSHITVVLEEKPATQKARKKNESTEEVHGKLTTQKVQKGENSV